MTQLHPLTEKILDRFEEPILGSVTDEIDHIVREHLAPPTYSVDISGARFPEVAEDVEIAAETTFVQSGSQVQMLLLGTEPVLVVQPEYNADERRVTFVVTAVDLNAEGMLPVLESLVDATREMISHVEQMREGVLDVNVVDLDPRQEP